MAKLLVSTQVMENYAWNEDGTIGVGAEAYWKAKGGNDYVVKNVDLNRVVELAEVVRQRVERSDNYFQEYVIGWEVVEDDYLTHFEREQLEYDGRISFPAEEMMV